jgi:hypothetical protein
VWVCMDADLQDPPEAVPALLDRLAVGDVAGVFAGRRGAYETLGRRLTGTLHRRVLAALTGLPPDAGAFLAMDARLRDGVLAAVTRAGAPSVVVAAATTRWALTSVPVERATRSEGTSSWSHRTRLRQATRTLAWAGRRRRMRPGVHRRRDEIVVRSPDGWTWRGVRPCRQSAPSRDEAARPGAWTAYGSSYGSWDRHRPTMPGLPRTPRGL